MKIKNVKPGDIINAEKLVEKRGKEKFDNSLMENRWIALKVYRNFVLTKNYRTPQIRRCFSFGDLVIMGVESSAALLEQIDRERYTKWEE